MKLTVVMHRLAAVLGMVLFSVGLVSAAPDILANAKRPNILFLCADDWAWPHASCLGCPVVKTPAFDRIAKEGVLFRNAHTAAPSCSPSRAAILTGQWHCSVNHLSAGAAAGGDAAAAVVWQMGAANIARQRRVESCSFESS